MNDELCTEPTTSAEIIRCQWGARDKDYNVPECPNPATVKHIPMYADADEWTRYYCDEHRCVRCIPLEEADDEN